MLWHLKAFSKLTSLEVYKIIKLRIDVFVVEQNCPYADLDDKDIDNNALHLFATDEENIACYLRILPPDSGYPEMPTFGRVVTAQKYRGAGIGHQLVKRANKTIDELWPGLITHISAQAHLQAFYERHQFVVVGETYLEDDIPHIGMERVIREPANK